MKCFQRYEWICENSIPPNHRVAELFQTIRNKVPCGSFSRFVNVVTGIFSMFTTWWAAICENVKFVWNDASTSIVVTRVEAIRPMPYNLDQVLISGVSKKKNLVEYQLSQHCTFKKVKELWMFIWQHVEVEVTKRAHFYAILESEKTESTNTCKWRPWSIWLKACFDTSSMSISKYTINISVK